MRAKICGIMTVEAAQCAVRNGADMIGFVFTESKRRISAQEAASIIETIPSHVKKVGVFVNPTIEELHSIIEKSGIDVVQLHGSESPEFCKSLPYPIIKAFSIESLEDVQKVLDYDCEYVLLDGPKGKYQGGNGETFNWELLKSVDLQNKNIILAGGLNALNVRTAIETTNPYAVDVSSGVESNGQKDLNKIKEFLTITKNMEEKK